VRRAIGVGCGLERLAMLRYGIDDIRKVETARVA
jgi:phenylalanyl-tRNA synthetase alpha subunit